MLIKPSPKVSDKYASLGTIKLKHKIDRRFLVFVKVSVANAQPAPAKHEPIANVGGKIATVEVTSAVLLGYLKLRLNVAIKPNAIECFPSIEHLTSAVEV